MESLQFIYMKYVGYSLGISKLIAQITMFWFTGCLNFNYSSLRPGVSGVLGVTFSNLKQLL